MALGRGEPMDNRFRSGRTRSLRRRLSVGGAALTLTCLGVVSAVPGSSPAFADTVVDGCNIVANPTAAHFTDCPGVDFSSADLSGVDLSYANLTGAVFARCIELVQFPYITCPATDLNGADLHDANVSSAVFTAAQLGSPTIYVVGTPDLTGATLTGLDANGAHMQEQNLTGLDMTDANFTGADLSQLNVGSQFTGSNLTDANFTSANLEGANLSGVGYSGTGASGAPNLTDANFTSSNLEEANFTGTVLLPVIQPTTATSAAGAIVTWSSPPALPGATPGPCSPPSGSLFPVGTTDVTCTVTDSGGGQAYGFASV